MSPGGPNGSGNLERVGQTDFSATPATPLEGRQADDPQLDRRDFLDHLLNFPDVINRAAAMGTFFQGDRDCLGHFRSLAAAPLVARLASGTLRIRFAFVLLDPERRCGTGRLVPQALQLPPQRGRLRLQAGNPPGLAQDDSDQLVGTVPQGFEGAAQLAGIVAHACTHRQPEENLETLNTY